MRRSNTSLQLFATVITSPKILAKSIKDQSNVPTTLQLLSSVKECLNQKRSKNQVRNGKQKKEEDRRKEKEENQIKSVQSKKAA